MAAETQKQVMADTLGDSHEPAWLQGYGPIPADAITRDAMTAIRRLDGMHSEAGGLAHSLEEIRLSRRLTPS